MRVCGCAGGTGERVAREPLTGRVAAESLRREGSGPVGERATPTPGQDPHTRVPEARSAIQTRKSPGTPGEQGVPGQ